MTKDKEGSLYANIESKFDIHSVSKLMAKACIVKMEEKGQIDRKDKLSKYIPNFPRGDEITIENLLNNESGLPRELRGEHDNLIEKSPEELVELIKREKLLFKTGSETLYSN